MVTAETTQRGGVDPMSGWGRALVTHEDGVASRHHSPTTYTFAALLVVLLTQ